MTTEAPHLPYPPIEPHRHGMLALDELHTMYWEESGNPQGAPVLFLHGGPGSGTAPRQRQFFDPAHYRIVLFDQRGAGKSTPLGETRNNTTALLIEDIERLRTVLGIEQWLVFGGSWGSTLALAYGEAHPARCLGFILRGIFLCTPTEIEWFLHGMGHFFPQAYAKFLALIPPEERADLLEAYCKRLFSDDPQVSAEAARCWSGYEGSCLYLLPHPDEQQRFEDPQVAIGVGRLEAHYFRHQGFMEPDQLVRNVERIRQLPAIIVQGRYDVICPPATAWRLHQAWPEARLQIIEDAGHAAFEPGIEAALVEACNRFRDHGRFRRRHGA
ncbi:MAG: prolyl aminopeptidase [Rhodoferax sp.]|nr:prolyl aminopeptidase [Rhodoferax sp.]